MPWITVGLAVWCLASVATPVIAEAAAEKLIRDPDVRELLGNFVEREAESQDKVHDLIGDYFKEHAKAPSEVAPAAEKRIDTPPKSCEERCENTFSMHTAPRVS